MSSRQLTVGGPSVAAGEWTRAHKGHTFIVAFVAFITLGLIIFHIDVRDWQRAHLVKKWQYKEVIFPCQVRAPCLAARVLWERRLTTASSTPLRRFSRSKSTRTVGRFFQSPGESAVRESWAIDPSLSRLGLTTNVGSVRRSDGKAVRQRANRILHQHESRSCSYVHTALPMVRLERLASSRLSGPSLAAARKPWRSTPYNQVGRAHRDILYVNLRGSINRALIAHQVERGTARGGAVFWCRVLASHAVRHILPSGAPCARRS